VRAFCYLFLEDGIRRLDVKVSAAICHSLFPVVWALEDGVIFSVSPAWAFMWNILDGRRWDGKVTYPADHRQFPADPAVRCPPRHPAGPTPE
jgi:hypothetical protein